MLALNPSNKSVSAYSTVSDSCNQSAANNVNNGVPTAGKPETTELYWLIKSVSIHVVEAAAFEITVTGNNPQPQDFTLRGGESQSVTLGPGSFVILDIGISRINE